MILRRSLLAAFVVGGLATPAAAEWRLPCIIGGCSITFVSPEYAARPVQPLKPEAALAAVNAFRIKNGRRTVVLVNVYRRQPRCNRRRRPSETGLATTGPADHDQRTAPCELVFAPRSPRRMSPLGRNRSAT